MLHIRHIVLMVCWLMACLCVGPVYSETLKMTLLMVSDEQRASFDRVNSRFKAQNPGVRILLLSYSDSNYKKKIDRLVTGWRGYDVVYWQGGQRLFYYIDKNYILPLDDVWQDKQLDRVFSKKFKALVSRDNSVYAVPYAYYHWGFFYSRKVFNDLSLTVPKDWESFLQVCKTLKANRRVPIALAAKDKWPVAAWFDYINLRVNGYRFHKGLLGREAAFERDKVMRALSYWKALIDNRYFSPDASTRNWSDAAQSVFDQKAGMILMGNFIASKIVEDKALADDIGFFPFPVIRPGIALAEEAPVDVLFIPRTSRKQVLAKKYLAFIASAEAQTLINAKSKTLPPNSQADIANDYFSRQGKQLLRRATNLTQYFDRDTNRATAAAGLDGFKQFIMTGQMDSLADAIERARLLQGDPLVPDTMY